MALEEKWRDRPVIADNEWQMLEAGQKELRSLSEAWLDFEIQKYDAINICKRVFTAMADVQSD